jgi:hypothetical protein
MCIINNFLADALTIPISSVVTRVPADGENAKAQRIPAVFRAGKERISGGKFVLFDRFGGKNGLRLGENVL